MFRGHPLIVAHASELEQPGDFVTHDATGVPIVLVRDAEGTLRAFINACRHRGSRLVDEARGEKRKAFTCRYHAWSYDLRGGLLHVPFERAFPDTMCERPGLVALPVEVRHGFVWVVPTPGATIDIAGYLGAAIDDDLAAFGLATHVAHRRTVLERACNWKYVIDAFLEGYHVTSLHRDSIYRFFLEAGTVFDAFAPHTRSVGARRTVREARATPVERWDVRELGTVFYLLFPNTILVFHPDWVSHIAMLPLGTGRSSYAHTMLIPARATDDAARAHWDKTFALIDARVFQKEDLAIAEGIQSTAHSGADTEYRIGRIEAPIRLFHDAIDRALAG